MPLNNTADIINKFELYVGDQSELSDDEELDLAQKIYDDVLNDRPWEFLKKNFQGAAVTVNGITSLALPADFKMFTENNEITDNSDSQDGNARQIVVFVGTKQTPFQVVNFSDRRRFQNRQGYCWLDLVNRKIVFTQTPTTDTLDCDFDYIYRPPALDTVSSNPVFPQEYWDIIFHGMATDSVIIELFDRTKSYAAENKLGYNSMLSDLAYYNSQLRME